MGTSAFFRSSPFPKFGGISMQQSKAQSPGRMVRTSRLVSWAAEAAEEKQGAAVAAGPWLLVGLGNPGSKFEGTRHNVGFAMIDRVAHAEGISISAMQNKALVGKGRICGIPVLLAKPQTYMNLSGEAVRPLAQFYKIPKERVLVMYDDLDLELGVLKLLPKGGHGGHNGMKSIIQNFKASREFPRLRIGIGRPPGNMNTAVYVLQRFGEREQDEVDLVLEKGLTAVRSIMAEGLDKTISSWNATKKAPASLL